MNNDSSVLFLLFAILSGLFLREFYDSLSPLQCGVIGVILIAFITLGALIYLDQFSKAARERKKLKKTAQDLPEQLRTQSPESISIGIETDLKIPIYLPDNIRSRHVHILGSTGSGKTESVILNFLKQDIARGLGAIILDAKGDSSFLKFLSDSVQKEKLHVFDLGSAESQTYDPLLAGNPMESSQRLYSSLVWSEEYYASKARHALLGIFDYHFQQTGRNPTLVEISQYLQTPKALASALSATGLNAKNAEREFNDLSGLRDQISSLCTGYLKNILSSGTAQTIDLTVTDSHILYFRLQSLLSPQLVSTVGRFIINHLNYLAGVSHRSEANRSNRLLPVYLDEFASFACPEFADLISKARSARMALHFSHQSIGDLAGVSEGFLNRITDNSATKIVLRVNDPDSAEYFSRSFGTKQIQKVTQRITNTEDLDGAKFVGEGSQREAHQFRAPPDLFKTLPTGVGSVLIAHGAESPQGATSVFIIRFPVFNQAKVS